MTLEEVQQPSVCECGHEPWKHQGDNLEACKLCDCKKYLSKSMMKAAQEYKHESDRGEEDRETILSKAQTVLEPIELTPELTRETTFMEIGDILSTTIKHDYEGKIITFCDMLQAQSDNDQFNICFQSDSSTGKSYIPMEVADYFPHKEVKIIGGASPTAFFHEAGVWNEETRESLVDQEGKILIFTDQPHTQLLQKLRSFLSHDKKELIHKITDKNKSGANRTKTIILRGYSAVIFCTANFESDEQEQTRMVLVSASSDEAKLQDSLKLLTMKAQDPDAFQRYLDNNPERKWLKNRIRAIRQSEVRKVKIPDAESLIYERFRKEHSHLVARNQRDYKRLVAIIKSHALLNVFSREKEGRDTIKANDTDIEAGFSIYNKIAESNERGLSPHVYKVFNEVVRPLIDADAEDIGIERKDVMRAYVGVFHRPIGVNQLSRIITQLVNTGLVEERQDPDYKLKKRLHRVSEGEENSSPGTGVRLIIIRINPPTIPRLLFGTVLTGALIPLRQKTT